jgi:hypothetical protein
MYADPNDLPGIMDAVCHLQVPAGVSRNRVVDVVHHAAAEDEGVFDCDVAIGVGRADHLAPVVDSPAKTMHTAERAEVIGGTPVRPRAVMPLANKVKARLATFTLGLVSRYGAIRGRHTFRAFNRVSLATL